MNTYAYTLACIPTSWDVIEHVEQDTPPIQALADARFAEVVAALGDEAVSDGLKANRTHEEIVQRAELPCNSGGQT